MAYLAGISIYPLKSLDGLSLSETRVLPSGALEGDRQWAIFDQQQAFINGKRNPKVHRLRTTFDQALTTVSLQTSEMESPLIFPLKPGYQALEAWLSEYFGEKVQIQQNLASGFPDDPVASGPTVISTATLETVASWFPDLTPEELRLRMRANLEIGGVPAFWEDQLFAESSETTISFQIGEVRLEGVNPCQRCIVPTRHSQTGESYPQFQKIFTAKRQETLPDWVPVSRFNHFYRLSVNTRIPASEAGKILRVGDPVKIFP